MISIINFPANLKTKGCVQGGRGRGSNRVNYVDHILHNQCNASEFNCKAWYIFPFSCASSSPSSECFTAAARVHLNLILNTKIPFAYTKYKHRRRFDWFEDFFSFAKRRRQKRSWFKIFHFATSGARTRNILTLRTGKPCYNAQWHLHINPPHSHIVCVAI